MHVEGLVGRRDIPADAFFRDTFETAPAEGENLTAITVPKAAPREAQAIMEVARRSGDYAPAGLCLVRREGRHRVAPFSTGPKPMLASRAMAALDGNDIEGAVAALTGEVHPPSDTRASAAYRRHLAGVLLRRAVARITGETR